MTTDDPAQPLLNKKIAIVSVANDLHALTVRDRLVNTHKIECSVIEADRIADWPTLSWTLTADGVNGLVKCRDGFEIDIPDLDVIWWRRAPRSQQTENRSKPHADLVNNDCGAAFLGLLLNSFNGTWVSHPLSTRRAENKISQLVAARECGFVVPDTLVTQEASRVRDFYERHGGQVVVKAVAGTHLVPLLSTAVSPELLAAEGSIQASPAIYQEMIPGTKHLRVEVFGDSVFATLIVSPNLDWRQDLNVEFRNYSLEEEVKSRLLQTLRLLNLSMGVFDLKLREDGLPVWIEVNPQGQFLFIEGLTGLPLLAYFAEFLAHS